MTNQELIEKDMAYIEGQLGNQVMTWQGSPYVCSPSSTMEYAILDEGGFNVELSMLLKVRKSLFSNSVYPKKQQTLTYNGKIYRIQKVSDEPFSVFIKLFLTDSSKGA